MFFFFGGRPLGYILEGAVLTVLTFRVGGVGKSSEFSDSVTLMTVGCVLFLGGGFEAGLGVSTDFDLDLEARLVEADGAELEG